METSPSGYVYICETEFGFGLFSDSNQDRVMYFLQNPRRLEWAEKEGVRVDENLPLYREFSFRDFLSFLSTGSFAEV